MDDGLGDFGLFQLDDSARKKKVVWLFFGPVVLLIVICVVLWIPSSPTLSSQSVETSASSQQAIEKLQSSVQEFPTIPLSSSSDLKKEEVQPRIDSQSQTSKTPVLEQQSQTSKRLEKPSSATTQVTNPQVTNVSTTQKPQTSATQQPATTKKVVATTTVDLPPPSAIALNELRNCLTGGDYTTYSEEHDSYGAYYFIQSTWNDMAEASGRIDLLDVRPDQAKPQDQDVLALELYNLGYARVAWPGCGHLLF